MSHKFSDTVVIETAGDLDDLEVVGSNLDAEQLQLLLGQRPYLRVRNQNGIELHLYFDMDEETLVAAPALLD